MTSPDDKVRATILRDLTNHAKDLNKTLRLAEKLGASSPLLATIERLCAQARRDIGEQSRGAEVSR